MLICASADVVLGFDWIVFGARRGRDFGTGNCGLVGARRGGAHAAGDRVGLLDGGGGLSAVERGDEHLAGWIVGGEHVLVDGATVVASQLRLATLILTNGAMLTHPRTGLDPVQPLDLAITNLSVDASSRIDVDGFLA